MKGCKKYPYVCDDGTEYTVCISKGNGKMGDISSVSLPRLITCPEGVPCRNKCYMRTLAGRPNVKRTYAQNWKCYKEFPARYWFCITKHASQQAYFRWHVCGDIPDMEYLNGMIEVAKNTETCKHLCFTKNYSVVNAWLDYYKEFPYNMIVVFSRWDGYCCDNRYNLPEAWVDFADAKLPNYVLERGRRCRHSCNCCNYAGDGCWDMKPGDIVILNGSQIESEETELDIMLREFAITFHR